MDIKEEITKLVEEKIAGSDNFLVEVKVTPGKVLVTLDHPQGIMIEECVKAVSYTHLDVYKRQYEK